MDSLKTMFITLVLFTICCHTVCAQNLIQNYLPAQNDSLRIGTGDKDFLPFIKKGYTLMFPDEKAVHGVLILLEDSGFDETNKNAKSLYALASENGFAVLSVSTEIPFDFYFSKTSMNSTYQIIQDVFSTYKLPNKNIFFLGASLVGHRAMQFIKFMKEKDLDLQLDINGIVICNFTLDWTRKWHQDERELRIKKNNLWEATFINFMLETNLNGTPKTVPENYHNYSPYSYFDDTNQNIKLYSAYAILAIIEPDIAYRLSTYKTLYENNTTDIVGFLAEQKLAGNQNTELIIIQPKDNRSQTKGSQSTWEALNKNELMDWIVSQTKE